MINSSLNDVFAKIFLKKPVHRSSEFDRDRGKPSKKEYY
jgi:hypothetical protein